MTGLSPLEVRLLNLFRQVRPENQAQYLTLLITIAGACGDQVTDAPMLKPVEVKGGAL